MDEIKQTEVPVINVIVNAPGWYGRFVLPESCFIELTSFLANRACVQQTAK